MGGSGRLGDPDPDYDVIIIGGGPVGLGLGIDLAQRGVSALIVERYPTIQQIPKGQNLTQRSGEHFKAWGVQQQIRDASLIPRSFGNSGLTAFDNLLSGYHYDWFNRASVAAYYNAENERLPQFLTEKVLRARAAEFSNLEILYGWRFDQLDQDETRVIAEITAVETDQQCRVSARYLVGADGARSGVRDAAGIALDTQSHDRKMALLVFHSPDLDDLLAAFPGKAIFNALGSEMQGYWQFLGRVDLNGNWFFHAPVDMDATIEDYDFAGLLARAVGAPVNVRFDYVGFWDLRFSLAEQYQSGRVFIAGDAAHSHPPYGGYGINTGFEDARNLAWKLAAVMSGWAGPDLLASYTAERKPVFASTRDDFIAAMITEDAALVNNYHPKKDKAAFTAVWDARANGDDSAVTQFLPHIAASPVVWGAEGATSGAKAAHRHQAEAGFHLSPALIGDGVNVFDQLGDNFALITVGENAGSAPYFMRAADEIGLALDVIQMPKNSATDQWQAEIILVRPDHFIAYAGVQMSAFEGARRCLSRAVGRS